MESFADFVPAEKHDCDESRFHTKRHNSFYGNRKSKKKKYTPKGVIYKILPENSSDWDNATSIQDNEGTGENVVFTGLTPGTTYLVKAEMASIASNIISVKTETELQIPNHNMEDWHYVRPEHASKYW